jgi:hypothetical protein
VFQRAMAELGLARYETHALGTRVGWTWMLLTDTRHLCSPLATKLGPAGLVAHSCNPSSSGGTDQEDHSSKPAPGK